ncbi:MAG: hypothetical protein K940chlam2_01415 [Chlamydiae bacterium]|nr:hypothetical protein [Chlamydiota bacterium]
MTKKVGRNQPCPCGSGKKYKKCCLKNKKPATIEHVPPSTWDYATRWVVNHKGKVITIVRQIAVTIDRDTGEKLPHPYIAQMHVDGRTVRALTRPDKIAVCRAITMEKCA